MILTWTHVALVTTLAILVTLFIVFYSEITTNVQNVLNPNSEWQGNVKTCNQAIGGKEGLCLHYAMTAESDKLIVAVTTNKGQHPFQDFVFKYNDANLKYITYLGDHGVYDLKRIPHQDNVVEENTTTLRFKGAREAAENDQTDVHLVTLVFKILNSTHKYAEKIESYISARSQTPFTDTVTLRTPAGIKDPRVNVVDPVPCEGYWSECKDGKKIYQYLRSAYKGGRGCYESPLNIIRNAGDVADCM